MLISSVADMRYYVFVCFGYVSSFISAYMVMQYSRQNMSDNGHIVYTQNRRTVQQIYREEKNNDRNSKLTKRSINKTNERST